VTQEHERRRDRGDFSVLPIVTDAKLSTENRIFQLSIELFDRRQRKFPFATRIVSHQITFVPIPANRNATALLCGAMTEEGREP
jgi:hypothetical protein